MYLISNICIPPNKFISEVNLSLLTKQDTSLLCEVNINPPCWHLVSISNGTTIPDGRSVNLSEDDIGAVCTSPSCPNPKEIIIYNSQIKKKQDWALTVI